MLVADAFTILKMLLILKDKLWCNLGFYVILTSCFHSYSDSATKFTENETFARSFSWVYYFSPSFFRMCSYPHKWAQPTNTPRTDRGAKSSGVASPEIFWGKMSDFRRITLLCLEKRLSKHKMAIFSKHLGGHGPFRPPLATPMAKSEVEVRSASKLNVMWCAIRSPPCICMMLSLTVPADTR